MDALGYRKKIGIVVPSTNTIVGPECEDLRPLGVTNHVARAGRSADRAPSSPPNWNLPTTSRQKTTGDGAAGDLSIIRPAAAAPPRWIEQVEQHRAAQLRARVTAAKMVNAEATAVPLVSHRLHKLPGTNDLQSTPQ